MQILDLCSGIATFSLAAKHVNNGSFYQTVACSEIEPFCNKVLDKQGYELLGDLDYIGKPDHEQEHVKFIDCDLVPCEETGFTSVSLEDINEGVVTIDMIIAGSPCQNISPANTMDRLGIDGEKSSVIYSIMEKVELIEPGIVIIENSSALIRKGLHVLLSTFNKLGYIVEWSTIAAANFGFNHYRHRCFVIAYLPNTKIAKSKSSVFKLVSKMANKRPGYRTPLLKDMTPEQAILTRVENTKSIKLRTKRINALGNSVVFDVAYALLQSIADLEMGKCHKKQVNLKSSFLGYITNLGLVDNLNYSLFEEPCYMDKLPPAGYMDSDGNVYITARDNRLNPKHTSYTGMSSTLLNRDGNNNFSTKSRLNRPGKLGGLTGDLMREFGFDSGGLNPIYCEQLMGLPEDITNIY